MGNILSKICDDYECYCNLCEFLKIEPRSIYKYRPHESRIMLKYGYERTYFGYKLKDNGSKTKRTSA